MRLRVRPVPVQCSLVAAALGAAALAPTVEGAMLLVPVGADQSTAIRVATAHGARLLGPAAAGTLLVWADASAVRPLASAGVIAVAAPFIACGKRAQ